MCAVEFSSVWLYVVTPWHRFRRCVVSVDQGCSMSSVSDMKVFVFVVRIHWSGRSSKVGSVQSGDWSRAGNDFRCYFQPGQSCSLGWVKVWGFSPAILKVRVLDVLLVPPLQSACLDWLGMIPSWSHKRRLNWTWKNYLFFRYFLHLVLIISCLHLWLSSVDNYVHGEGG